MLVIKNGMVYNAIDPRPVKADILVVNGKIIKIDKDIPAGENVDVIISNNMLISINESRFFNISLFW